LPQANPNKSTNNSLEILGSYKWTSDEIARAGMWHYRANNRWMGRWLAIILLLVAAARLILAVIDHEAISVEIGFIILLMVIALLSLLLPQVVRAIIRMNFAKRPEHGKTVNLQVTAKKIIIETEDFPTTTDLWDKLEKIVQTREGLLCYTSIGVYHWLPFNAFKSEDANALLELARQYPEKLRDVR
jgi:hypothetical protein